MVSVICLGCVSDQLPHLVGGWLQSLLHGCTKAPQFFTHAASVCVYVCVKLLFQDTPFAINSCVIVCCECANK